MNKTIVTRQRIGPQIRHLRQMRGLTLDDLAEAGGLSASHLSRLERSQTLPSFTVLANISQVLGVSIDEFVQLEHDLQELDEQLAWQAELLSLDENAYREIVGLSIDTRRQLNSAIEVLSNGRLSSVVTQEEVSAIFEKHGSLEASWPVLSELIKAKGLNPVGLSRGLVQLLEIPGPRLGVLMSPGLLASSPSVEYAQLYRALGPALPIDPLVARNWEQWHKLAGKSFPFDWSIRLIVNRYLLDQIRERFAESDHIDGDHLVREIARYWTHMLEVENGLEIALMDESPVDGNMFVAGHSAALFERHSGSLDSADDTVGIWVSSNELVSPVARAVDQTWKNLPAAAREPGTIRAWLEHYAADKQ